MNFNQISADRISEQLQGLDQEAIEAEMRGDNSYKDFYKTLLDRRFGQLFNLMQMRSPVHVIFGLGLQVGYRLAEAKFIEKMVADPASTETTHDV